MNTPTISILQPYAWLIIRPDVALEAMRESLYKQRKIKDVENRNWRIHKRGRFLVHAGLRYTVAQHEKDAEWLLSAHNIRLPAFDKLNRGGVIGEVEILGCEREYASPWKDEGSWGWILRNARPRAFQAARGHLGVFYLSLNWCSECGYPVKDEGLCGECACEDDGSIW